MRLTLSNIQEAYKTPFDATSTGIATNTLLGLFTPEPYLNVGAQILHGIARSFGSVGQSILTPFQGEQSIQRPQEPGLAQNIFDLTYGKEGGDVQTINQRIADSKAFIESSPFAKKWGLDKFSMPLAIGGVVGSTAMDLSMFGGGGEESLIKQLIKETDPSIIAGLLKKTGINESLIPKFSEIFAKATTPDEVKTGLDLMKNAHGLIDLNKISYGDAKSWTINELQTAEPGSRAFVPAEVGGGSDVIGLKSTFPDWVPKDLAHRDLFDQAIPHLEAGTVPVRDGRVKQLVELAREQMGKLSGLSKDEMFNAEGGFPGKTSTEIPKTMQPLAQEAGGPIGKTPIDVYREAIANPTERGLQALTPDLQAKTVDWINSTKSDTLSTEALGASISFRTLDKEGLDAFAKIQAGETTGDYGKVKQFFADWYDRLTAAGVDIGKRTNYFTQLWKNSPEEVQNLIGKKLSLKPGITMETILKDYKEGISAGLTPRFTKVSDVVGWYQARATKLLEDTKFFNYLKDNGFIRFGGAEAGWKAIDPNVFPIRGRAFSAPIQLADAITNYLGRPSGRLNEGIAKSANIMSALKNFVMSVGIPKTGFGVHGFTELARSLGSTQGKIQTFVTTFYRMMNPDAALRAFEANIEHATFLSKYGLKVSAEEHIIAPRFTDIGLGTGRIGQTANTVKNKLYNLFGENLFGKIVPAAKTEEAWNVYQMGLKAGLPEREAAMRGAEYANNLYGGINYEGLGRDKSMTTFWRAVAFAPDFLETNYKLGKGMVQGLLNPSNPMGKIYRSYMYSIATVYTGANVLNYKNTGNFMWQNGYGHETDVAVGKDDKGRTIYFKPFGSSVDFIRLPIEVAHIIVSGDQNALDDLMGLVRNRLSKGLSLATGLTFNVDPFGNKIYSKDKYGRPIPLTKQAENIGSEILGSFMPATGSNLPGFFGGTKSAVQTGAQALGLPFAFKKELSGTSGRMTLSDILNQNTKRKTLSDFTNPVSGNRKTLSNF